MRIINQNLFNYIYDELEATYKRDFNGVKTNLNNDREKNLQYLGTYYPRSYAESYHIYSNIFDDIRIYNKFNEKNKMKILDIGSGTGGSLMGLLQVLNERFSFKEFEIVSIEGNSDAVEIQSDLLNVFENFIEFNGNTFKANVHTITFNDKSELDNRLSMLSLNNNIDIMHSFKVVNEFYRDDYNRNKGLYKELLRLGDKWLKDTGVLCLVDVTDKIENVNFISILFNEEVKEYLRTERTSLSYILPKCCAINYNLCRNRNKCFSAVSVSTDFYDAQIKSKINYKLFIKGNLGQEIRNTIVENGCDFNDCYCRGERSENCTKIYDTPYIL